ncbi:MAG: amidase family protein [Erysipelotrichaceae bacterium]
MSLIKELLVENQPQKAIGEAIKKAHESQEKLNAVVTFVDEYEEIKPGKLSGIPIVLKDNVSTKGIRTTASSRILENYVPVYDATIVEKLHEAGAVIIAKASMDELAMGGTNLSAATGPVHNPYDINRIPGGSSGGSAALVAAGVVPMAIGSDTGDSIRKPASFCGIVGVKPTYGKISRYGIIPYASSLDHVGYFTRSVSDAALALEVLQGYDPKDMTSAHDEEQAYSELLNSDLTGKKILVFKDVMDSLSNQNITASFEHLIEKMQAKGAIIRDVSFDAKVLKTILPAYYLIANCEATANHSNLDGLRFGMQEEADSMEEIMIASRTKGLGANIRARFVMGSFGLFDENQEKMLKKAQRVRRVIVDMINAELSQADILIAPAASVVAPLINGQSNSELSDEYLIADNHMVIGNFAGLPSMTLPLGYEEGLPFGVNITANAFSEQVMFNVALAIEEITGIKDAKVEC